MPERALQKGKQLIEFYPELEYIPQDKELSERPLKVFIAQSKISLQLYSLLRFLKRKRTVVDEKININRTHSKSIPSKVPIVLIKKYASTHPYSSGKKPQANIAPEIIVNRRRLYWHKYSSKRQIDTVMTELLDI
jgi:hypothetical protein